MLPEKKHLAWNTSEKFKLLGIYFNLYKRDKAFETFSEKIKQNVKNTLSSWACRDIKNNGYENISPRTFGADYHSTTNSSCLSYVFFYLR